MPCDQRFIRLYCVWVTNGPRTFWFVPSGSFGISPDAGLRISQRAEDPVALAAAASAPLLDSNCHLEDEIVEAVLTVSRVFSAATPLTQRNIETRRSSG